MDGLAFGRKNKARVKSDLKTVPSLLDRLTNDLNDTEGSERSNTFSNIRQLKEQVKYDLECLLNTRTYRTIDFSRFEELETSLVNYGLPDFSSIEFGSEEHIWQFCQQVAETIERFETRLKNIFVDIEEVGEDYQRTLYLKISCVLMVKPDPVPLHFDSKIQAIDRPLKLRELSNG